MGDILRICKHNLRVFCGDYAPHNTFTGVQR